MPDFSAKMHQIQFQLGLRPRPHWESPLVGWVGAGCPVSKNPTPLSGLDTAFFRDPKPKSQTAYICAQGRHVILSWIGTPHF